VDDDQVDRALVIRTLKKSDLNVKITEALTVDEGLSLFRQASFDIVLLDYRMPKRDGIEMILELRNEPKDNSIAIVMMSASEDEDLALDCIKAGAQDFLVKSEITEVRLKRALLQAATRFELEKQLFLTYQQVKQLAETDSLTSLPNRYFFDESLKLAIANNLRTKQKLALLLFDLDHFKMVNDTFGHDTGDVLLKKIVTRIKGCLRGNELFARLGGDEFGITLSGLESTESASLVAKRIITVLQKPLEIAKTIIHATASIGIAIHPDNGCTSDELFKYADIAMYRAKKLGRNQVCFFEAEMQENFSRRMRIETELRSVVDQHQLRLYFQPVIDPEDESLKAFEALLRWEIDGDIRLPDEFIVIAEETQQIIPIGLWVIEEAISTLAKWNQGRAYPLRMAINVSSKQFNDDSLCELISACLEAHQVDPDLLDIELTETALFKDTASTQRVITQLSELGCRLSLDDFGTGFSSISHLQNYPIDVVKIDKSLMPPEEQGDRQETLLRGLVAMTSILGLEVIAEGVETRKQLDLCRSLGIRRIQGYYYSRPLTADEVVQSYL
jgi:diguanylate cyclase (GGDEF)-like protein